MRGHAGTTVVLVTGASSGLGRAIALTFAARGYRVFGTSRAEHADDRIEMVTLDVRSDSSVRRAVDEVLGRAGHIDVLVNNAGIVHSSFAEETDLAEAQAILDVNVLGVARVAHAVLPGMRARGRGRIVNIGSLAARVGEPGEAFYAASKAALARYTEALRHEVWTLGLSVSLVEPGAFRTGVLDRPAGTGPRFADYDGLRESASRVLRTSLERGGDPKDVARLVLRVAESRTPRLRYGVGAEARWLPLLRMLPQRWFDRLVRHGFGLDQYRRRR